MQVAQMSRQAIQIRATTYDQLPFSSPEPQRFLFKLLNEWLWVHPKISFFSLVVENLMRYKVKNATLLRICLYFLKLSSTERILLSDNNTEHAQW